MLPQSVIFCILLATWIDIVESLKLKQPVARRRERRKTKNRYCRFLMLMDKTFHGIRVVSFPLKTNIVSLDWASNKFSSLQLRGVFHNSLTYAFRMVGDSIAFRFQFLFLYSWILTQEFKILYFQAFPWTLGGYWCVQVAGTGKPLWRSSYSLHKCSKAWASSSHQLSKSINWDKQLQKLRS